MEFTPTDLISSVKVLVLGHTHVYCLGAFAGSASPSGLFADFAVLGHACDVYYLGLRGATASSVRAPAVRSQIVSYGADVVVLHVGGNDLVGKSAPRHMRGGMRLATCCVRTVGYGCEPGRCVPGGPSAVLAKFYF